MANERAKAGGEIGKNGEFYKGGSFLPNTQLPKRGAASRAVATRRALVMPGVLEFVPEGRVAVFPRIAHFVDIEQGKAVAKFPDDHCAVQHHFTEPAELHRLIAAYNSGTLFE